MTNDFRFGNYIGEPVDSEDEAQDEAKPQPFAFDEAFEDEEVEEPQEQQLMEVDGTYIRQQGAAEEF